MVGADGAVGLLQVLRDFTCNMLNLSDDFKALVFRV